MQWLYSQQEGKCSQWVLDLTKVGHEQNLKFQLRCRESLMTGCCVSGSLSDEQKGRLLRRFKVLCLAGLPTEGNQTDSNNESTLIRCNCCYNLPVETLSRATGQCTPLQPTDATFYSVSLSRPWWCFLIRLTSCQSSTHLSLVFVVTQRSAFDEVLQPVSTRSENICSHMNK